MSPVRLEPDVEALSVSFLRDDSDIEALVDDRVATKTGQAFPCIRLQRVGGSQVVDGYLHSARVQVESWAEDEVEAYDIAATAEAVLLGVGGSGGMRGVHDGEVVVTNVEEAVGLFHSPDPTTGHERYRFDLRVFSHTLPAGS